MGFTFQELRQLKNDIAAAAGISTAAAARVIGYYNGGGPSLRPDIVAAMIAGDFSHVGPALVALGISGNDHGTTQGPANDRTTQAPVKDPEPWKAPAMAPDGLQNAPQRKESKQANKRKQKKTNTSPQALQNDLVKAPHDDLGDVVQGDDMEHVQTPFVYIKHPGKKRTPEENAAIQAEKERIKAEKQRIKDEKLQAKIDALLLKGPQNTLETVQADIIPDDDLPDSIQFDIEDVMQEFAQKYKLDLWKISGLQWRAVCLHIGSYIQKSGVLLDMKKSKTQGHKIYNPHKVAALLPIWENFTTLYKHVPIASDFIAFTGVSADYFYNTGDRLTSGLVDIAKKARDIEERALSTAIVDSRENPTGRIYYTKARLGWRETAAADAAPAVVVVSLGELPKLGKIGG